MNILGAILLTVTFGIVAHLVVKGSGWKKSVGFAFFGFLCATLALMCERLTKVSAGGVELYAEAKEKVGEIEKMRLEVEGQKGIFQMAVRDANSAQLEIQTIRKEIQETSSELAMFRERIEKLNALSEATKQQQEKISEIQQESERQLANMKEITEFNDLVARAQSDDWHALKKLTVMAESPGPLRERAGKAALCIHELSLITPYNSDVSQEPWKSARIDPQKASYEEFLQGAKKVGPYFQAQYLSGFFAQEERFGKPRILKIAYETLKTTGSIKSAHLSHRVLDKESKIGLNFLGYNEYIKWWETHKSEYIP